MKHKGFKRVISVVLIMAMLAYAASSSSVTALASEFEYRVLEGRLLVCGMKLREDDPGANWLKGSLISYATGSQFKPVDYLGEEELDSLLHTSVQKADNNNNIAFNINDKAAVRRKK